MIYTVKRDYGYFREVLKIKKTPHVLKILSFRSVIKVESSGVSQLLCADINALTFFHYDTGVLFYTIDYQVIFYNLYRSDTLLLSILCSTKKTTCFVELGCIIG